MIPLVYVHSHDSGSAFNTHRGSSTEEASDSIGGCSSGQGVPDSPDSTRDWADVTAEKLDFVCGIHFCKQSSSLGLVPIVNQGYPGRCLTGQISVQNINFLSHIIRFTGPLIYLDFNFAYFAICTIGVKRNYKFLSNL